MDTPQDENVNELNVALEQQKATPAVLATGRNYYLYALVAALGIFVLGYFGLSSLPSAIPAQYLGFGAVGVAVLIIIGSGLFSLATRFAKVPTRSFDKALFITATAQLLNQIVSFATRSISIEQNIVASVSILVVNAVVIWFLIKGVYATTHRKVLHTYLWLITMSLAVVIVIGLLAGVLFNVVFR